MTARLRIVRAGPLTTIQDEGREGFLAHGISASGPMDRGSHRRAGLLAGASGEAGIEITRAGLDLLVEDGDLRLGWAGGEFALAINGKVPVSSGPNPAAQPFSVADLDSSTQARSC